MSIKKIAPALVLAVLFTSSSAMAIGLQYTGVAGALGWGSSDDGIEDACDEAAQDAEAQALANAQADCPSGTVVPLNIQELVVSTSLGMNGVSECEVLVQVYYRCTI